MSSTDVSVVTATYNSAGDIERNIRCVGTQTLLPKEHIVVDDGSTDDTLAIVEKLRQEFPHVKLIKQSNGGAGAARNTGIKHATGRYIAFLDSDDLWSSRKLEHQISFMAENEVAFSYGEYGIVEANSGDLQGVHKSPDSVTYDDLLRGCPVGCLTVAYDQEMLGKRYMSPVRRGQDWGCWLELTRDGSVGRRYPGLHATYRRSKGSLSSDKLYKVRDIFWIYRMQEGMGPIRSAWYMLPHVTAALMKRYVVSSQTLNAAAEENRLEANRLDRIIEEASGTLTNR